MIFISVGTEKFQFDRLIRIIDQAKKDNIFKDMVVGQIGNSKYEPNNFKYYRFLENSDYMEYLEKSRILITHAGVGTLLNCLELKKVPIILPRLSEYGEHLDNHQQELAFKLDKLGLALLANDEKDLITKVINYNEIISELNIKNKSTKTNLVNYLIDTVKSADR